MKKKNFCSCAIRYDKEDEDYPFVPEPNSERIKYVCNAGEGRGYTNILNCEYRQRCTSRTQETDGCTFRIKKPNFSWKQCTCETAQKKSYEFTKNFHGEEN